MNFVRGSLEVDTDVYVCIHHNAGGEVSCSLPQGALKLLGDELQLLQFGGMPKHAKPFKGFGSAIVEIAQRDDKDAYRTVVAVQLGKKLCVLHAFQKKSNRGIVTPKADLDLIEQRYKEATELAKHEN